jgi:hypothetical protein
MKKVLIGIILVIIVVFLFQKIGDKEKASTGEDVVYQNTINISRTYVALRIKTDKILKEASTYPDYDTWDREMTELIDNWENLEEKAEILESQADFGSEDSVSFKLVNEAYAYSKDEISNVFDKAPAGKKIKTLAKFLGVDAKRAFKILKSDQEFVKADAWNEAGDTFKKLEVSAVVIKDGCKVAGFVGAMAITGGAASVGGVGAGLAAGTVTAGQAAVLVVTGTDLVLEVGEDAATIALGDQHKAVKAISNIRSVTDPAASLLSLKDIPKNVSKGAALLDKVGVVLVQVDQVRSMVQDGKLLGINIKPDDKKAKSKVEIASLNEDEVKAWLDEHKEESSDSSEDLDDWLDELDDEDQIEIDSNKDEEEDIDIEEETDDNQIETNTENGNLNKAYTKDGKVSVSMQNVPEPISVGHTKMWEVQVDGYEYSEEKKGFECYWDFYTEYSTGVEPWMNLKGCKRTGGVPGKFRPVGDPPGELRVVVRVDFMEQNYGTNEFGNRMQDGKKVAETITLEKTYVVTPWGEG